MPLLLIIPFFLLACASQGSAVVAGPPHHTHEGFQNHPKHPTASSKGVTFYLRRAWGSMFHPTPPEGHALSESEALSQFQSMAGKDAITWLGHATFLIRLDGKTILTDPFLTKAASPSDWFGPKRFVEPGISIANLPAIDMIMVSHNHYDHLDEETVASIPNKANITVFVPLGVGGFFRELGYEKIIELDWYKSSEQQGLRLTALPAVHDSARTLFDANQTLWNNWVIEGGQQRLFVAGDTGYSETLFKEYGNTYGHFDLAILPIGAYEPRELMWMSHITPEEAVQVASELNAKLAVASHWGTIEMSDEPHWEPAQRFKQAATEEKLSHWIMKIGESRRLP